MRSRVGVSFIAAGLFVLAAPLFSHAVGKASDAMCPQPTTNANYERKDISYPGTYKKNFGKQTITITSLWRKPCEDNFIKAFCTSADFCDGTQPKSLCYVDGEWLPCARPTKEQLQGATGGVGGTGSESVTPTPPQHTAPSNSSLLQQLMFNPEPISPQGGTAGFQPTSFSNANNFLAQSLEGFAEPAVSNVSPSDTSLPSGFLSSDINNVGGLPQGGTMEGVEAPPVRTSSEGQTGLEGGGTAGASYFQQAGTFSPVNESEGNPFDSGGQRLVNLTCQGGGGACGPDSRSAAAGGTPLAEDMRGIAVPADSGYKIGQELRIQGVEDPVPVTDYTRRGSGAYVVSGAVEKELGGTGRDPAVISLVTPPSQTSSDPSAGLERTLNTGQAQEPYAGATLQDWANIARQENAAHQAAADAREPYAGATLQDWADVAQRENAAHQAAVDAYVNQQLADLPLPEGRTGVEVLYDLNRRDILAQAQLDYDNSQATGNPAPPVARGPDLEQPYPAGIVTSENLPPAQPADEQAALLEQNAQYEQNAQTAREQAALLAQNQRYEQAAQERSLWQNYAAGLEGSWAASARQNADLAEKAILDTLAIEYPTAGQQPEPYAGATLQDWASIAQQENATKQAEVDSYVDQQLASLPLREAPLADLDTKTATELKQIEQQLLKDRQDQAPEPPKPPTLEEQLKSWWSDLGSSFTGTRPPADAGASADGLFPGATSADWERVAQQENAAHQNAVNEYVDTQLAGIPLPEQPTGQEITDSVASLQPQEPYPGASLDDWADVARQEKAAGQSLGPEFNEAFGSIPSDKTPTSIRVSSNGEIDAIDFYNAAVQKFAGSSLNGYAPAWGKKFGIDGSPESWARFATQLAQQESSLRVAGVNADGSLQRFSSTPAGEQSFGPLQFNKGEYGLTTWADVNDPGKSIDALIRVAEQGKTEAYFGSVQRPGEITQQNAWFEANVAPHFAEGTASLRISEPLSQVVAENIPLPQSRPITADLSSIASKIDNGVRLSARDMTVLSSAAGRNSFISRLPEDQRASVSMYSGMIKQMGPVQASFAINFGPYAGMAKTMVRDGLRSVLGR